MKYLTAAEWDELHRIKRQHEILVGLLERTDFAGSIEDRARSLAAAAEIVGVVVTIEQVSLPPLAMGHYETVVSVRPVLARATP